MAVCSQCGVRLPAPPAGQFHLRYLGRLLCSRECGHAAGDRSACLGWDCGCTRYAKKRRWLRAHREQMCIMDELIAAHDLDAELEQLIIADTGDTGFYLGSDSELDEQSDAEDPERQLRAEATDQRALVQAVQGALECRSVLQDLERARMELADAASRRVEDALRASE